MDTVDRRAEVTTGAPGPDPEARELDLVRRTAARDRDAFRELYVIYHRRLARFLTRMTRHADVADEIINDTLWIVWQRAAEFRGSSRVSTWIMGIAYRRALKAFRRASLHVLRDVDTVAAEQHDAGAAVEDADRRQLVTRALAELPLEQRIVLELTYYIGHSCQEIAEIMDCPVNTVKTRMVHARRKLRALLPGLTGGETILP